jgi:methylmalonyl-CoA mutase, C-terminal domain
MKKVKILIAKPGLDGHDRGAKVVCRALRDAGFNVIYTGIRQTPEQIVQVAIDEDVDFIGLSSLSGAHMKSFKRVLELLKEKNAEEIKVIGGGVIPGEDIEELKKGGIAEIFTPGTSLHMMVDWINNNVSQEG